MSLSTWRDGTALDRTDMKYFRLLPLVQRYVCCYPSLRVITISCLRHRTPLQSLLWWGLSDAGHGRYRNSRVCPSRQALEVPTEIEPLMSRIGLCRAK